MGSELYYENDRESVGTLIESATPIPPGFSFLLVVSSNLSASAIFKKTPDLIKFWGFLLSKIYPYEYHSLTAKYLIDRYY